MNKATKESLFSLPNLPVWKQTLTPKEQLKGKHKADVVIIGAGYTGLWTAYYLVKHKPDLKVVIVEKEHVGFGASGRNGGWASAVFPISLSKVASFSSKAAATKLQLAMNDTVDIIGQDLKANNIEADYSKQGLITIARTKAQLIRAKASLAEFDDFNLDNQWQFLDQSETQSRINVSNALGATYTPHCALVHPGKLVKGLSELVTSLGVTIYENSAVTKIEKGLVQTELGEVQAPIVVRATESFTSQFKQYKRNIIPLYSLVLATEPIPQDLLEQNGLNHRMAFTDFRHMRVYAQVTSDNRLVFGGRGAPYAFGSKILPQYDLVDSIHAKIQETLTDFFPSLSSLKITHRWGGPLAIARDWCPSIGFDKDSGFAWAGQYVGDGVATSNISGRILRNLILDIDDDINDLPMVNKISKLWEPEPFRWLGVNLALASINFADMEENITNRPSFIARAFGKLTGAH